MILCGNVFLDELKDTFILCCVLCKKKSRRYNDFTSHVKAKHKELNEKGATPSRQVVKKIKDEDDSDDDEDEGQDESEEQKPEVEVKDEMDVDPHEEFIDDIKYDVQEIEPFIDPILALEEKESADATDVLDALDSDVKDEDYVADELDNDDSDDEDYRDEDNDNAADSETDDNELPISTDKFTPTFYRKKRHVNDFIELYKSQPVLWDINDPLFENPKAQKDAEQAIINGMQKFNIFLKPTGLRSAINQIHKYCVIIKSDLDNGDTKKVTSIAKGYYEKCDFLKDLLAKKAIPEGDKQNKPLTLKQWDDNTSKFIDAYAKFPLLYDGEHPLYGNFEEVQKANNDLTNTLLTEHNIDFKEETLSSAINQLHSWYYDAKQRKAKQNRLKKEEEEYFKKCNFLPARRLKTKFYCHVCKKNFKMEHNLKGHLFRYHQIGDLPFQCEQCGKKFEIKSTLQTHIQRMHVSRKFPCGFCGKLFAIKSELKVHNMVHTAEKPHVCELCGKAFRIKTQLRYHVTAIHTKIRAYKCTMCPKDFLKKRDLTDHIKTHLNIRDKICETCGKGFSNSHSLIRHRQIHSEVKRYACKLCDAKFHQFVGLNGHMKRTHNIELNKKQERNKNREQDQNLLNFKKLDENTFSFIETYEKFPQLYDGNHPLYENVEEKLKSLTEFADRLLLFNGLNFSIQTLTIAIRQLQSWYYHSKTRNENRKKKLNDHEMEYFRKCSFFPPKRLIDKYFCTICKQQFTLKSSLDGHLFRHHQIGDLSFECDKCGRKYAQKNILREHVQRMHGSKEFSCGFCGKLFAIKSELKVHTMVHTAEKPHVCELCGKAFRIKTQLRYHVTAIHTKIRAYKCTMCPKDFLKKRDLTDHIKTHLNIRDKVCETCGKGFSNNHSLIRHRQIHSEVKRYACKLCDAKYHQFVGLNSHMKRTHNILDGNTFSFIEIYEKFPQLYDGNHPLYGNIEEKLKALTEFADQLLLHNGLNLSIERLSNAIRQLQSWYYHSKTRNENQKRKLNKHEMEYFRKCSYLPQKRLTDKYFCTICKKIFNLKSSLDGHLFRYHQIGDLSFECDECGKKFSQKTILQQHVQRMHASRKYRCEFCDKLFATKSEQNFHTRIHTDEKPHVCEFCGKSFRIKTQLGYHVNAVHTKIRAHKCTMCPKDFLTKRDLTDHIKAHLNIRDKICETCGKGFSNNHSFRRHRQIHSEIKRYECKMCDEKFNQLISLHRHKKRIHKNKPLNLDQWDDTTCKFIEIYEKFPLLYDKKNPLYGNLEDKQKALTDISSTLKSQHNIDFSEELIAFAIDELKSWLIRVKRRKGKLDKTTEKYLKMCKFMPAKRSKEKIPCSMCEKVFYTEHNLKYHLTKVHKVGDFSFQCDLCGKKLVSKNAVLYHNLRVHVEKKYPCEFCGKLYAIPAELKVHTRIHTAEKPHVCELCGKCFRLRNLLSLHVTRMHTKIRAFKCTMCPKDFLKNTDLRDHMKSHLNIRDKICETCGKGFTNCHSLIRHRQIHSDIKKFACKLCDAKFHQFVGLNGHMKRTHNINPLTLDKWNETTCKFIDIYAKFPLLYDPDHPLHGKNVEKQKALSEIRSTLLSQHNINFSDEIVTEAIDQLRSWYYSSKRRQHVTNNNDDLKKCYSKYLKLCKFLPEKQKRVKFPCSICNKIFYTENHCKYHLSKVHQIGEISFQCTQCGKKLVSNSALQSHTQRVHSGKEYPCEFCGKLFTVRSQLKLHILVHTNEKPHVCELCGKGFRLRNNLGLHVTSMHTKIRAFKCTMCPKDFLKNADLKDHIKTHLNIRDKICDTCGKGFTNCHSLRRHRQIHSEIKKFACKLCDAKFHQFVGLNGHMKRTHNIKPLILDKWDDTTCKFIDIYAKFQLLYDGEHPLYGKYEDKQRAITDIRNALLTQHEIDFNEELVSNAIDQLQSWYYLTKRQKHKNKDDAKLAKSCENYLQMCKFLPEKRLKVKIVCSICNKNFYTEHNFKYHLTKVHQVGDFSFQCDLCGKKLISKSALQCHAQRVHSEKKYPCEFCGKLFAIPSELRIHTLVHTAEKPHVCELCGKGFRLRNNLGLHVTRMHTKIRAFKCTMCPKDFLKNCDLKDHIKTHLNIRDKICETCGKGFTNCHSLIRHRQIHSEVKKFACKLCDAKFHQFVGLNGHMKRTHNIVKKDTNN
ncbi:Zinc finger protein 208 [Lucilia cuprina]|nr:Zinc finger protein 208 [Lucilia cuprina]